MNTLNSHNETTNNKTELADFICYNHYEGEINMMADWDHIPISDPIKKLKINKIY